MNLPNKLTVFRVILIPFFVFFMQPGWGQTGRYIALAIFIVASLTDLLDGKIARKYNLVTNFGKLMDPLADKLLVCTAIICLMDLRLLPAIVVIIIIAREFIISAFRLIAASNQVVIAAGWWGKFKTTFQMLMIIALLLHFDTPGYQYLEYGLMIIATALTIISLMDYLIKNKDVLKDQN
ncbi:CDP-diacylglycerol--glycerol-3-phosphate 3-phosphatidyltransferase [Lachnospiraceae bacterium XBB1006]|nr:CDP-diacylglycerol--glycerol-3-phosphate 3-phosphatidyltransferase [Lachnospiraceae bacterium XBB1006]